MQDVISQTEKTCFTARIKKICLYTLAALLIFIAGFFSAKIGSSHSVKIIEQSSPNAAVSQSGAAEQRTDAERQEAIVYITSKGNRYHFARSCGGDYSFEVTLETALRIGKTPCKRCAQ